MICKEIEITNAAGLHARPATVLVKNANRFESDFFIKKDEKRVNGKSIIEIITLAAEKGDQLILKWDGSDEQEAADRITYLFENDFELQKP